MVGPSHPKIHGTIKCPGNTKFPNDSVTIYKFPTNMDDGDHDGIDPDLGKYLRLGKYLCDLCPSVFTSKAGLNDHVKSFHLGEKRFSCDKCGKMVRSGFLVLN